MDNTENIWQAAKYLSDQTVKPSFSTIARVRNGFDLEVKTPEDIGNVLLENFFPLPPPRPRSTIHSPCPRFLETSQLPGIPLTLEEVRHDIFKASPLKGPGEDGLPALVWQKLWPVLQHHIFALFEASLKQGKLPKAWKMAKTIPLKKSGKPNDARAFRPISLLSTLSKAIEAVIAERISYLVERHGLLPLNHYGAPKRKCTTDALLTVQEKIYQSCRDKKVLSLVTFDLKGAFNGVATDILLRCLRAHRIPEDYVRWIQGFARSGQQLLQ